MPVEKGGPCAAPSFLSRPALVLGVVAVLAASVVLTTPRDAGAQTSREVRASLEERGLGRDVLGIVPNTVFDAGQQPPRGTMPFFLRQIAAPAHLLDDPVGRFERGLHAAAWPISLVGAPRHPGRATAIDPTTTRFVRAARGALTDWRGAISAFQDRGRYERTVLNNQLGAGDIAHGAVTDGLDAGLDRAVAGLGRPTLQLLHDLIGAQPIHTGRPISGLRHIVGTTGPDTYRPQSPDGITLITDPGGDDRYDFSALAAGAVLIVVDAAGSDTYVGAGGTLTVLVVVDYAGNDRWGDQGPGPASAFGGLAAVADLRGDDIYEGTFFGQAAAALGRALLFDAEGDDRYEVRGFGQGFAATAGAAVLMDGGGNDDYKASGDTDAFDRGGRVSIAQGVGFGSRQGVAGGIAALIDLAGDDTYEAELFAQGHGFFFGMGLLVDHAGDDRYQAVRYAQGAAAHVGIGVLVDEAGHDAYDARVGVAQGMGLDRSIGLLSDVDGNDRYDAGSLAQGASTANGLGVISDQGGSDRFSLNSRGWGEGHWSGGLPGAGFMLGVDNQDIFVLSEAAVDLDPIPRGGPHASGAMHRERASAPACVGRDEVDAPWGDDLAAALAQAYPLAADALSSKRAHVFVRDALRDEFGAVIALAGDNEHRGLGLLGVLRCVTADQGTPEADAIIRHLTETLNRGPVSMGWMYAGALVALERPTAEVRRAVTGLAAQPDCTARVAAIELARRTLRRDKAATSAWIADIVRRGLRSRCWREKAVALRFADTRRDVVLGYAARPTFLQDDAIRQKAFSTP